MAVTVLTLLPPGVSARPLFETEEEYQEFRRQFIEHMEKSRFMTPEERSEVNEFYSSHFKEPSSSQ